MTNLRAGLSGCGAAGRAAVAAVRQHDHCDIVAAWDPDPAAAKQLQREAKVGLVTEGFAELLATGVDFVVLTGPCGARLEQVELACEQGVHLLLHAPMAPTLAAAEAMVAACGKAEVRLGVAVPEMADPVVEQVRRMFADGWFGALVAVHAFRGDDDLLRHPPAAGDARLQADLHGGDPLTRLVAAAVHLATWLTGRSGARVAAQATRGMLPLAHDTAAATAVWRGNAQATFAASHLCNARALSLHGTDGSVSLLEQTLVVRGERAFAGDAFGYDTPGGERVFSRTGLAAAFAHLVPALELHGRFARWLEDLDGFPCPADQALQDMRLVDAMQRALVSGATEAV